MRPLTIILLALLAAALSPAAASAAKSKTITATVLSVDRSAKVARVVIAGEARRVPYRGTLPKSAGLGTKVRVSGKGTRRTIRVLGRAKELRVRGRVVRTKGGRGLRLADRSVLRVGKRAASGRAIATTAATQTIVSSGNVTVSLEGFPIGLTVEIAIRFGAGGAVNVTVKAASCCRVPDKPRVGDTFTVVGYYDPELLYDATDDVELRHDEYISVSAQQDPFNTTQIAAWTVPYPAAFRSAVRALKPGDAVRIDGHMRAFDPKLDPEEWEYDAEEQGGIWVADRVVALDDGSSAPSFVDEDQWDPMQDGGPLATGSFALTGRLGYYEDDPSEGGPYAFLEDALADRVNAPDSLLDEDGQFGAQLAPAADAAVKQALAAAGQGANPRMRFTGSYVPVTAATRDRDWDYDGYVTVVQSATVAG